MTRVWTALSAEGSTRRLALLRIGIALLLWVRFADELAPYQGRGWAWSLTGVSIVVSATALLVGWHSRAAAAWAALSVAFAVVYLGVVQRNYGLVHHHVSLLMIVTLLLAFTPCGRSFSVDRWLAIRRGTPPSELGPVWGTWLIALQASAVWFWGAIDKLKPGWLSGERLEAIVMAQYFGSDWPTWGGFSGLMMALAIGTVVVEFALAVGLFFPRTHRVLIPLAAVFHGSIYFAVPVSTFSATMLLLLLAFIPPARIHALTDRLLTAAPPSTMPP